MMTTGPRRRSGRRSGEHDVRRGPTKYVLVGGVGGEFVLVAFVDLGLRRFSALTFYSIDELCG